MTRNTFEAKGNHAMTNRTITPDNFTRVNNDTNGNPRYVLHFLKLNTDDELDAVQWIDVSTKYVLALARSRAQGGRKFHNKQYGGGIVFQSYNLRELCARLNELRNEVTA
jgi:hypothetical protein